MNRSRTQRIITMLLPALAERGLDGGTGLIRWAEPPWSATLRSSGKTHRMTLSFDRIVLDASWTEGADLLLHHFDQGGWDDYFITAWDARDRCHAGEEGEAAELDEAA
jgi:hypothetical protein